MGKRKSIEQEPKSYVIDGFDPSCIADNTVICLYGRRGSGKSTMLKHLLYLKRHIQHGLVCSATEKATGDLERHVPAAYIRCEYDDDITKSVIKFQRKAAAGRTGKQKPPAAFLVFDDTMFDKRFPSSPETRRLFMNGRHYNIYTLITSQYAMDLPPAMRANIDYVIMFNEPTKQNRVKLYNNFGGIFPSYDHFERVFLATTQDYHCMVVSNVSQSHDVRKVVFRYKCPEFMPAFTIGSRGFWADAGEEERYEAIMKQAAEEQAEKEAVVIKHGHGHSSAQP